MWHQIGPVHLPLTLWDQRIQAWVADPESPFSAHSRGGPRCARPLRAGSGPGELGVGADVATLHCPRAHSPGAGHTQAFVPGPKSILRWHSGGPAPGLPLRDYRTGLRGRW